MEIDITPGPTAASAPAGDPPDDRSVRHWLLVCSCPFQPQAWHTAAGAGRVDVPSRTAPACTSRPTTGLATVVPALARNGTPASGSPAR